MELKKYIPHAIGLALGILFIYFKDKYEERRVARRRRESDERWEKEKIEMEALDPIKVGFYYCYNCGLEMLQPILYMTCRVNGHGGTFLVCATCFDKSKPKAK